MKWLARGFLLWLALASPVWAQRAFQPFDINTANAAATTASLTTALVLPLTVPRRMQVRVFNAGTGTAYIRFGVSGVTTTVAAGVPVPPGTIEVYSVPEGTTHVATITGTGTASVFFTAGEGI
jgi:hypothetical protein